jgi:predicted metal-dependent phosphoesterase TrpH
LHDPNFKPLNDLAAQVKQARFERAKAMVEALSRDFPISWPNVAARAPINGPLGRPHIADELVAQGVLKDRTAAFERLLHPRGPYYVRYWSADAADVIDLICQAGGVPVMAHPGAARRQRIVDDHGIGQLVKAGLAGLEVYHRDNPPEQQARLAGLAKRYSLLETGGSDYHGPNGKPNRIGENLTSPEVMAQIATRGFLPIIGRETWAR